MKKLLIFLCFFNLTKATNNTELGVGVTVIREGNTELALVARNTFSYSPYHYYEFAIIKSQARTALQLNLGGEYVILELGLLTIKPNDRFTLRQVLLSPHYAISVRLSALSALFGNTNPQPTFLNLLMHSITFGARVDISLEDPSFKITPQVSCTLLQNLISILRK